MLSNIMARLTILFEDVRSNDDGQGVIEYVLIAAFISVVAFAVITAVGVDVTRIFRSVDTSLGGANAS